MISVGLECYVTKTTDNIGNSIVKKGILNVAETSTINDNIKCAFSHIYSNGHAEILPAQNSGLCLAKSEWKQQLSPR